jgi:group I intron endonuclease
VNMGCLYRLTSPTGKQYIGITAKDLDTRWEKHMKQMRAGRQHALQNAFRKHGPENFKREVLVIADDWEYLCDLERKAIAAFGSKSPSGYNLTDGGEGIAGLTEESREKMAASMRKAWERTKPGRLGHLAAMRAKKDEAMAVKGAEDARREKIAKTMTEVCKDESARERLRSIAKIVWNDPERRAALLAKRQAIIDAKKKASQG